MTGKHSDPNRPTTLVSASLNMNMPSLEELLGISYQIPSPTGADRRTQKQVVLSILNEVLEIMEDFEYEEVVSVSTPSSSSNRQ